jgi:UDP:flavonoid glycosyltransferase YjiC (YdhE family)
VSNHSDVVSTRSAQGVQSLLAGKRILFVAEAVTLAHVARPLALSSALENSGCELSFACDPHTHWLLKDFGGSVHALNSIDSAHFLQTLAQGRPLYDVETLDRYVADDLNLLGRIRPDLVVGDFRLSLSISARLASVPYMTISNAYWSPYVRQGYPLPEHPLTQRFGLKIAQALFQIARPLVFAQHALPLNHVRKRHGLPVLGYNLNRVYTDADHVLYADVPEMFTMRGLPDNHHFLGPILWSPPVPKPDWWQQIPQDRPILYVTLGSSGQARLLPLVLEALAALPVTVMLAGGGQRLPATLPDNLKTADYLPGMEAAKLAQLVICNGGSPTSHQALAAGVPVLGLSSNLDQFLNMQAVEARGAGLLLRADQVNTMSIRLAVEKMRATASYTKAAQRIAHIFDRYPAGPRFKQLVETLR